MKKPNKLLVSLSREYVPVLVAVLTAGFVVRLAESILVVYRHGLNVVGLNELATAALADLQLAVWVSLPVYLLFMAMRRTGTFFRKVSISVIIALIGSTGLLLAVYFSATLIPLGPEFWAYSVHEILDTVIAAESNLTLKVLAFILFTALLIWFLFSLIEYISWRSEKIRLGLMVAVFGMTGFGTLVSILAGNNQQSQISSNKLSYFITAGFEQSTQSAVEYEPINNAEYPFLKRSEKGNVLGPFFKELSKPPNIVFILVESLGGEFIGRDSRWGGFAPFIDSLTVKSLYWKNGLSMSGRTFGMIPSLLGSLPPGRNGFMDLGPDYPVHSSIIRMLKDQGYQTSFYSGYNTYFDGLNYFLDYQGTEFIVNKEWITNRYGNSLDTEGNYWGYDDKTLFNIAETTAVSDAAEPRLEIYHTLQSHSPFTVPDENEYSRRFDVRLNDLSLSASKEESLLRYRSELTTLLYTDDALRSFINSYRNRESYSNTIFIITGDHWLIPVPQTSQISRYHVPIIIYSEMLRKPVTFESVNTHANVAPALSSFLRESADLSLPDSVHWIGQTMDTSRTFRNIHSLPFMKNKNQLSDYISGSYFLSDNTLYEINEGLNLSNANKPKKRDELIEGLSNFKSKNVYVTENNRLYPKRYESQPMPQYGFITRYAEMFQEFDSTGLSIDEQFRIAREYAFDDDYERSRAISKRLLLEVPDYHDIRILMGRTYAWNREYDKARELFKEVIRRDSTYFDTYNALYDTEYWSGNYDAALNVINTGLSYYPQSDAYLQKKIRILLALKRTAEAKTTYTDLKNFYPTHEKLSELENQIF
jgi:phosphoglycerol transferase MdoB-like AlkP superfamily enzyme